MQQHTDHVPERGFFTFRVFLCMHVFLRIFLVAACSEQQYVSSRLSLPLGILLRKEADWLVSISSNQIRPRAGRVWPSWKIGWFISRHMVVCVFVERGPCRSFMVRRRGYRRRLMDHASEGGAASNVRFGISSEYLLE